MRKNSLLAMIALVAFACATAPRSGSSCTPVPMDRRGGIAEVYQRCEVDTPASLPRVMPRPNYTLTRTTNCARVQLEMVVDDSGRVRLPTVKVLRTTEQGLTDAVIAILPALRYAPAQKGGRPVAQLVEYGVAVGSSVRAVGASQATAGRPPRPAC